METHHTETAHRPHDDARHRRRAPRPGTLGPGLEGLGRRLRSLGLAGVVIGLAAAVIAWVLVDGSIDSIEDSLDVTGESVAAVADTIDVIEDALTTAATGLGSVRDAVADSRSALRATGDVLEEADGILAEAVPAGLDAVRGPLPGLITSSDVLVAVLESLSFLGVDYAPDPSPAESLREVDAALADLARRLEDPEVRLTNVSDEFQALLVDLEGIDASLAALITSVDRARDILASYEGTTDRAASLVDRAATDLAGRRALARLLVVLLAALVIASQAVPVLVGRTLEQAARAAAADVTFHESDDGVGSAS